MAQTESSAVVRFIDAVRQEAAVRETRSHTDIVLPADRPPARRAAPVRKGRALPYLLLMVFLMAAGVAGGLYLSRTDVGRDVMSQVGLTEATAAAAPAPAPAPPIEATPVVLPAEPEAPEPSAEPTLVVQPLDDEEEEPEEDTEAAEPTPAEHARVEESKERSDRRERRKARRDGHRGDGVLLLGSKPSCRIFIDGKDTGMSTPQRDIELPAGRHRIRLVNEEFGIDERFSVRIKANDSTRVVKDLSSYLK